MKPRAMRDEIMWAVVNVKTAKRIGPLKDTRAQARARAKPIVYPAVRVARVRVTEAP
jgi:predicted RNA-binding protein with PUA-like domain